MTMMGKVVISTGLQQAQTFVRAQKHFKALQDGQQVYGVAGRPVSLYFDSIYISSLIVKSWHAVRTYSTGKVGLDWFLARYRDVICDFLTINKIFSAAVIYMSLRIFLGQILVEAKALAHHHQVSDSGWLRARSSKRDAIAPSWEMCSMVTADPSAGQNMIWIWNFCIVFISIPYSPLRARIVFLMYCIYIQKLNTNIFRTYLNLFCFLNIF
jgi:hypothetical protein